MTDTSAPVSIRNMMELLSTSTAALGDESVRDAEAIKAYLPLLELVS